MTRQLPSPTIDVDELRAMLAEHQPVTVLDVRKAEDRAEWAIPGSLHVDAYEALKAGDPTALDDGVIPRDAPVVTVCGAGKVSFTAMEQLRARGYDARSLTGGMKAWSLAWNSAEVTVPGSAATVIQVRRTGKGCLSYLIGNEGRGRRHRCGPGACGLSGPRGPARLDHHPRPGYPRPRRPSQPLPTAGRGDRGDAPRARARSGDVFLHSRSRWRHPRHRLLADCRVADARAHPGEHQLLPGRESALHRRHALPRRRRPARSGGESGAGASTRAAAARIVAALDRAATRRRSSSRGIRANRPPSTASPSLPPSPT